MSIATTQSGGKHYKGMAMQPVYFAYANGWDDCAFSTLKYVSRHRAKAGALDLSKAIDFVDFRVELIGEFGECKGRDTIPMEKYLTVNGITGLDAIILRVLDNWVRGESHDPHEAVLIIKGAINDLRVDLYEKEPT